MFRLFLCALFCLLFARQATAELRIFTDTSGRLLRGELVSVEGEKVTIKRNDGQLFTVKATMFCPSDLDYFRSHGLKMAEPAASQPALPPSPAPDLANLPTLKSLGRQGLGTRLERTAHVGSNWGEAFWDIPEESVLLGGFEMGESTRKDGVKVLRTIRPIWLTPAGPQLGETHGKGKGERTMRVLAKPGYAVGAVEAWAGGVLHAVTVTFMKVKGEELDPSDSYQSDLYGSKNNDVANLTGNGQPIVGVCGYAGDDMNQLCLVYRRKAGMPMAENPPARGGVRGKFYLEIDDAVKIYINGAEVVKVNDAKTTESNEVELKAGDHIVAQLINRGGPRFLILLFVSSDRKTSVSFMHFNFKILRDPQSVDFAPEQLQGLKEYAKVINKRDKPLPFKCFSEFIWGDEDLTAIGGTITPEMFQPLPQ